VGVVDLGHTGQLRQHLPDARGTKGDRSKGTVRVDNFTANPWSLYSIHGNVWEWVEDCWHDKL